MLFMYAHLSTASVSAAGRTLSKAAVKWDGGGKYNV